MEEVNEETGVAVHGAADVTEQDELTAFQLGSAPREIDQLASVSHAPSHRSSYIQTFATAGGASTQGAPASDGPAHLGEEAPGVGELSRGEQREVPLPENLPGAVDADR